MVELWKEKKEGKGKREKTQNIPACETENLELAGESILVPVEKIRFVLKRKKTKCAAGKHVCLL
jgi:hypothetical protein